MLKGRITKEVINWSGQLHPVGTFEALVALHLTLSERVNNAVGACRGP